MGTTPRHDRPQTWRFCLVPDCPFRVDPYDFNTRCRVHRDDYARIAAQLTRARELVAAGRIER